MATTLLQFRDSLRNLLSDKTQWRDTLLTTWIQDAIRDYSASLPRLLRSTINCLAGQTAYSLSSFTILQVRAVEYPSGQTPRRLLAPLKRSHAGFAGGPYYELQADHLALYIGESPASGEDILLEYDSLHAIPSSDSTELTVPAQHFELLRLYVIWKATIQLETDENVSVDRKRDVMNALGLNSYRAERAYRSRLRDILAGLAPGGVAGSWKMDKKDRIY